MTPQGVGGRVFSPPGHDGRGRGERRVVLHRKVRVEQRPGVPFARRRHHPGACHEALGVNHELELVLGEHHGLDLSGHGGHVPRRVAQPGEGRERENNG